MATAEEKGKRPRVDDDGDERMDDALMLSIEKLQQIQDEIEKVSRFVSQRDSRQSTPVVARRGCSGIRFGCRPFRFRRLLHGGCAEFRRNFTPDLVRELVSLQGSVSWLPDLGLISDLGRSTILGNWGRIIELKLL
jgi:hypothetical protein